MDRRRTPFALQRRFWCEMKKTTVINIYNFVRRSHEEPGRFIQDDYDTIRRQMELLKQLGLPSTYALKHDALIDPKYQELFRSYADEGDEIAAWWEITGELCRRAGVAFAGARGEVHDDRVGTAYSLGYTPEERKRLLDAYMADFREVFGCYPKTIGSWVIDIVTFTYAKERYGVLGGALCRDQRGTDGFTLWGGYVNGAYYPSRKNEMIPAQSEAAQLKLPIFRLLGPDPIYNFEEGFHPGITGVYSLEPSCVAGRDEAWIDWMFGRLTEEDFIGMSYAQVGQENNFLWENIEPGFEPQLRRLKRLSEEGKLRIETMAETAEWFSRKYRMTPPATFQASCDWRKEDGLQALWYSSRYYRIGFLLEKEELFIRDWFVYREEYPSRYLEARLEDLGSVFDALPLMDAHGWKDGGGRPKAELVDGSGAVLRKEHLKFQPEGEKAVELSWSDADGEVRIRLEEERLRILGGAGIRFTHLPVCKAAEEKRLLLEHEGFTYALELAAGCVDDSGERIWLKPEQGVLELVFAEAAADGPETDCLEAAYLEHPEETDGYVPRWQRMERRNQRSYPAAAPRFPGGDRVFRVGDAAVCAIEGEGEIRYTVDGSEPTRDSERYREPLRIGEDTVIRAKCFREGFLESEIGECRLFFGLSAAAVESSTEFDPRPVFNRHGIRDLFDGKRGSLDYQDGRWLGTQETLEVIVRAEEAKRIKGVRIGFLSHHRSGIILPDWVELYGRNEETEEWKPIGRETLPNRPGEREIERKDVCFALEEGCAEVRLIAHNPQIQPDWACYHGLPGAFLMADSMILTGC